MVFKRRDPKPFLRAMLELLWPRGGWARAFHYVRHRLRRLPDSPERIARGIWAGVFTTFTPFFGIHFVIAGFVAFVMRGNWLAALLATFFGNPLTYVPIAATSLWFGHRLLGTEPGNQDLGAEIKGAWGDIWHNFIAIFTPEPMAWRGLAEFYDGIFYPFMIGSIIPGIIAGTIAYYLSVPVIRAYQHRRKGAIKAKFETLKAKAAAKAAEVKQKKTE